MRPQRVLQVLVVVAPLAAHLTFAGAPVVCAQGIEDCKNLPTKMERERCAQRFKERAQPYDRKSQSKPKPSLPGAREGKIVPKRPERDEEIRKIPSTDNLPQPETQQEKIVFGAIKTLAGTLRELIDKVDNNYKRAEEFKSTAEELQGIAARLDADFTSCDVAERAVFNERKRYHQIEQDVRASPATRDRRLNESTREIESKTKIAQQCFYSLETAEWAAVVALKEKLTLIDDIILLEGRLNDDVPLIVETLASLKRQLEAYTALVKIRSLRLNRDP